MVRTHDKSIFIRLKEAELQNYSGKILQVEHIKETVNGWYYCLCEVLTPEAIKAEDELERVTKELKNLCHTILAAIEYDDNDEIIITDKQKLNEVTGIACDWVC